MVDINEVLAKLNPSTKEKIRAAQEIKKERQPLASVGLTRALGGGLRYGSQVLFWGNRSGGKSVLLQTTIAKAQETGRSCAIIDAEGSFEVEWAKRLGVDTENLYVSSVRSIEHAADLGHDLIKSGIDIVGVDSIAGLLPGSYYDDEEIKDFSKTGQIGQFSRDIGKMMSVWNAVNRETLVILVSQLRNKFTTYGSSLTPMGGTAMEHWNTTSIKLWSSNTEKETKMGKVYNGDLVFNEPVGKKVIWTIDKERGPGMMKTGEYDLFYNGDFVGIDTAGELLDLAVLVGKVHKGGAWYNIYGEKFQGKDAASAYLRESPEVLEKLIGEVM